MSATAWMVHAAPMGFKSTAPLRQRARYDFIELVRPDGYDVYSIEQQFGVYRWMVATAKAVVAAKQETGRWGVSGPVALLDMKPTCIDNYYGPEPIVSLDDLKRRFHYALLSREAGPSAWRWRKENAITVSASRILSFPHYTPFCGAPLQGSPTSERGIKDALTLLLGSTGKLTTQLNSCHADAVDIQCVVVKVRPEGFEFTLHYGIDGESCRWSHTLANTPKMWEGEGETFHRNPYGRNSEPFIHTLDRAMTELMELTNCPEI